MTYQFAQDILTSLIQIVAIAGFAGVFLHHLWKNHCCWMAVHCPPVVPFQAPAPKAKPTAPKTKKRSKARRAVA